MTVRPLPWSTFLILLLTTWLASAQEPQTQPAKDAPLSRESPEGTLRVFTLGVMLGNEQLIKATIIPVPQEELQLLLQKPQGAQSSAKILKAQVASTKIHVLKPGDVITLPGGKKLNVTDEDVSDDRMVLVFGDSPIPTRMYKAKGFWWVDANPVIAARKAAKAARN